MHRVLRYTSPEVILHIESAGTDIIINNSSPALSIIDCETCSLSKAIEIMSRRTEVEDQENSILFDYTT